MCPMHDCVSWGRLPQVEIVDKAHMPLVAFSLKNDKKLPYTVFDLQDKLREKGWIVPR
jgi:glutamate/tyrosine decarboxylase-like PLP-dependent enzyme